MNTTEQNEIWKKIDTLINNFKRYDLEKRIQYVAKNAVNLKLKNLRASQLQTIKNKIKQTQEEEDYYSDDVEDVHDDNKDDNDIANSILKENNEEVQKLNAEIDFKHAKDHKLIENKLKQRKKNNEKNTIEHIQKTATSAVDAGLMSSQIIKNAIQKIENSNDDDDDDNDDDDDDDNDDDDDDDNDDDSDDDNDDDNDDDKSKEFDMNYTLIEK